MTSDSSKAKSADNELDKAASEACTRSGTFALLLSIVLFLLCSYWLGRKSDIALAKYISYRLNLAFSLAELQKDVVWNKYLESHPDATKKPLAHLIHATVEIRKTVVSRPLSEADRSAEVSGKVPKPDTSGPRLSPPGGLTATTVDTIEIPELSSIAELWRNLNDAEMLTAGMDNSNYYRFSIVRWANRRGLLLYSNDVSNLCSEAEIERPRKFMKSAVVLPQLNEAALMNCVTVSDLLELSQFEMPQMTNPTDFGARVSREVEISLGSIPKEPYAATLVAEGLLVFVVVYFAAFTRQAVSSESFPARGTLFGGFSEPWWMLLFFLLALWMPFLASCAIAYASRNFLVCLGLPLVLIGTYSSHSSLSSQRYFGPIGKLILGIFMRGRTRAPGIVHTYDTDSQPPDF
jgi:hypothetical protein